jgi:hypothetical protein
MKPIGQTFFINEPAPPTGASGVYIDQIHVYFKSVSQNYGIELQLRITETGVPTPNRLPFASCILRPDDVYIGTNTPVIRYSDDASIPTIFQFPSPVYVEANKSYAFVLMPLGGNPEYQVWTSEIGGTDVTSKQPIATNNDTGDLFLSSNDISWTPVITEDIKFTIVTANFTSSTGTAVFTSPDEEFVQYKDTIGQFYVREPLVFGNGYYNIATLAISSYNGTFNNGDIVYQSNGTVNTAVGKVYSANSTYIKVSNTIGIFNTSNTLYDSNNGLANAVISAAYQNVITTASSNTVTVPDSSIHSIYETIYIQTNNRSQSQVVWVMSKPTTTTITTSNPITFGDSSAIYGSVVANAQLTAKFSSENIVRDFRYAILDSTTANSTVNLSGIKNGQMIGLISGASANLISTVSHVYNSVTDNFNSLAVPNTNLNWYFSGANNDSQYTADINYTQLTDGVIYEFLDQERAHLSRSDEYTALPAGRAGNPTMKLSVGLSTQNNKVSPVIDLIETNITYTKNIIDQNQYLNGGYLTINSVSTPIAIGDTIYQNTASFTGYANSLTSGTVYFANNTFVKVNNINGKFINSNIYVTDASGNGYIITANSYKESIGGLGTYNGTSRYISKNVVLGEGQDAEDILVYLSAYRPPTTNFNVYAQIQNSHDSENFDIKSFTKLREISPTSLTSSLTDPDDQVELVYGFYQSQQLFPNNTITDTANLTVQCISTASITNNSFIYLQSNNNTSPLQFNVREVIHVLNSTAFVIDIPPSFSDTDAMLGYIPGIETTTSAFNFDQNSNIVRYVTYNDQVYDSYLQFASKIVMIGNNSILAPRVGDLRVLALQQ